MSRSCYSDDYGDDFPGQLELYRANVRRSIKSAAGQARLRELRDALLALPVKALEADIFAEEGPDVPRVCALGAWALVKAGGDVNAARAMVSRDADDQETCAALKSHGWPRLVVMDAIYMNDGANHRLTPEGRYAYMLEWVNEQIVQEAKP